MEFLLPSLRRLGISLTVLSYRSNAATLSYVQILNKLHHWLQPFEHEIEQDESANHGADITGRRPF